MHHAKGRVTPGVNYIRMLDPWTGTVKLKWGSNFDTSVPYYTFIHKLHKAPETTR